MLNINLNLNGMSKVFLKFLKIIILTTFLVLLVYYLNKYGLETLRNEVNKIGIWAPLGIFVLRFTSVIIPALPSTAYSILAGALLGFEKGILIICMSDLVSCTTSFFIARSFGKNIIRNIFGNNFIIKIEKISKKHLENNFFLMTGFLMTGLFDFVSYAIGLTKTSYKRFLPALIISILLSNPPIVALGAGLLEGGKKFVFVGLLGIFILAIISNQITRKSTIN